MMSLPLQLQKIVALLINRLKFFKQPAILSRISFYAWVYLIITKIFKTGENHHTSSEGCAALYLILENKESFHLCYPEICSHDK